MKFRGFLILFGLLLPLFLAGTPMFGPPFTLPDFEYKYPANDSLWRKGFSPPIKLLLDTAILNSASFYGNYHLLPANALNPQPIKQRSVSDWMIWAVILSLGALSVAKLFYPHRSKQILRATLTGRHFNMMERDGNLFDETPGWLMFLNFLTIIALLVTQTIIQIDLLNLGFGFAPIIIFIGVAGLIILYLLIKWLLTGFFAWVFNTQKANRAYFKNIFLYNNLSGIILLPLVVFNTYNPSLPGLYFSWAVFLLFTIIKVIRGAIIGYTQARYSTYYLILYLCAIELAPVLILAKVASRVFVPG